MTSAKSKTVEPVESGTSKAGLTRAEFKREFTTAPVRAGDTTGAVPEFGRWRDLERLYGIRRGSAYNLLALGKIKGVLLRVRGQKSGVRLFDLASVRDYIRQCQNEQEAA